MGWVRERGEGKERRIRNNETGKRKRNVKYVNRGKNSLINLEKQKERERRGKYRTN